MDVRIQSVLIGIIVGWILSQLTDLVKQKIERKQKIKAVYSELEDLSRWLASLIDTSKLSLQLAIKKAIVTTIPAKLNKLILDEYFHEICMYLPRDARFGITDCYSQIEVLNRLIEKLDIMLETPSTVSNRDIANKCQGIFVNAMNTKFKVDYLVTNEDGDMHKLKGTADKLSKQIENELEILVEEARNSTSEELQRKHFSE